MNKFILKKKLDFLNIDKNSYSLDGVSLPDRIVLYNSYQNWEVFYFDERGNKDDEKIFHSEEEACNYIYKLFKKSKEIEEKYLK